MSKIKISKGTTNRNIPIFAWNSGSVGPYVGLVYNSAGLIASFRREYQSTWTSIPLVAGTVGSFTSGGLIADGSVDGQYQFGTPNAILATGADRYALLNIYGATNLLPIICEIELDEVNYQNSRDFGLTQLSGAAQSNALNVQVTGYGSNLDPATQILVNPTYKLKTNPMGEVLFSGGSVNAAVTGQLNVLVTGYTSAASPANFILINPGNKIDTNSLGQVVNSGGAGSVSITGQLNVLVTGYTTAANPATLILSTPANKLNTSTSGAVNINFDQFVPYTNTTQSVGDALNAARSNGFGKWVLTTGTMPPTLDIYAPDNITIIKTFTLDSVITPTTRS